MGRLYQVANQNASGASAKTRFLWDGDELVAEFDGSNNTVRRHLHGAGVDDPIASFEGTHYDYSYLSYLLADRQGCIIGLANDVGNASSRLSFSSEESPEGIVYWKQLGFSVPAAENVPKTWRYGDTMCGVVDRPNNRYFCESDGVVREFIYSRSTGLEGFQYPCTMAGELCDWKFEAGAKLFLNSSK